MTRHACQDFLYQAVIYVVDIGSAGLTLVLLCVSVYYLILYKLQKVTLVAQLLLML